MSALLTSHRRVVLLLAALGALSLQVTPAPAQTGAPQPPPPPKGDGETVLVPAGIFLMGTPADIDRAPDREKPQRPVSLPAFRIDRFEVTNALYARFIEAIRGNHPSTCHPAEAPGKDHTPPDTYWSDPEWNAPEKPVVGVDWFDAFAYCAWAGGRLPTEAEWEKAARGSDARRYPWGNEPPNSKRYGNFADESAKRANPSWNILTGYDDGFVHTAPVGSYPDGASPYGAMDMLGNVWEWVSDWYLETAYASSPSVNPRGPGDGTRRGLRGGSWDSTPNFLRVAVRYKHFPGYRSNSFGFRCARDVPAGAKETLAAP